MGEKSLLLRPFALLTQDLSLFLATTPGGSQLPVAPDTYNQMFFWPAGIMLLCTRMHAHTLRAYKHTQINIKINLKTKEKLLKTEK